MPDAVFARAQMGLSLGFHIVFAAIGIAVPVMMVLAEAMWRRTGDEEYRKLARTWAKGTAVFFAVGAVSGTVLSFELGLLFPGFMDRAGAIIGMPFSLEGFAFFLEAIFLAIYLYGWDRVPPVWHIVAGVGVAVSGLLSAVFVTIVNAWMNAPVGFRLEGGKLTDIDPIAAMQSPFVLHEVVHMAIAAYMATGLAAAAIHAWGVLRHPAHGFHRKALGLALAMAVPCSLAQPLVGHFAGEQVAEYQPMKLAAMEGLVKTQRGAPLTIGPIELPGVLSLLAFGDFDAEVKGLEEFPRADWPHPIVRIAWQAMVVIGSALGAYAAWVVLVWLRRRGYRRWLLRATVAAGPLGFVAIEAGWIVTEVGRQPWVVYGVLRTNDTVTPMPGLIVPFLTFSLIYLGLGLVVLVILRRQYRHTVEEK